MNGWQDAFIRTDGIVADDLNSSLAANLGLNQTGLVRRGYSEQLAELDVSSSSFTTSALRVTLARGASALLMVFMSLEAKYNVDSATLTVNVKTSAGASQTWTAALRTSYVEYNSREFLVFPVADAATAVSVEYITSANPITVQNAKLWVVSQSF